MVREDSRHYPPQAVEFKYVPPIDATEDFMKLLKIFALLLVVGAPQASPVNDQCPPVLNYSSAPLLGGEAINFCQAYRGKVILAVNTASQCGYTPQFKGLESLYQEYKTRGLAVLGFPSNDFKQEHEYPKETAKVSFQQYGVTFPMFARTHVSKNGATLFFTELASNPVLHRNGIFKNI